MSIDSWTTQKKANSKFRLGEVVYTVTQLSSACPVGTKGIIRQIRPHRSFSDRQRMGERQHFWNDLKIEWLDDTSQNPGYYNASFFATEIDFLMRKIYGE